MNTKQTHQIVPAVLAAGFLVAACGTASAGILLSDNFNTGGVNGTVDSFNASAGGVNGTGAGSTASRQTGSLAGTEYTSKSNYQNINNNQVIFSPGWGGGAWGEGRLVINHNFTDAAITTSGGFTISYNYYVPASASSSGDWLGIMFGETSAFVGGDHGVQINDTATPFGMLVKGNGGYESYADGTKVASAANLILNYDTIANQVVLTVFTTSFASGSSATVSATVNGTAINLGANANFTWGAGGQNYIQFEDWQDHGFGMNNLAISTLTAVPEPVNVALGVFGGLFAVVGLGKTVRRMKAA